MSQPRERVAVSILRSVRTCRRLIPIWLLSALVATALSACASGPRFEVSGIGSEPIPAGKGRLYLFRESHFAGAVAAAYIRSDGNKVGDVDNSSILVYERAAGQFDLTIGAFAEPTQCVIPTKVGPGEEIYIELTPGIPGFVSTSPVALLLSPTPVKGINCHGRWTISVLDKDAALAKMRGLTVTRANSGG